MNKKKYVIAPGTKCRIYFCELDWPHNNIETIIPQSYIFVRGELRGRNVGKFGREQCIYEEVDRHGEVKLSIWVAPKEIKVIVI